MQRVKELNTIREYFKPVQPTVKAGNEEIIYREVRPQSNIDNFIYCFWQLKTRTTLKRSYVYRVVSDGCIDILFNHQRPVENFIVGFCRKYSEFELGTKFDYIGIRFLPAAFPVLFGVDAKTLVEQTQDLKPILPDFSDWIQTDLNQDRSFEEIVQLMNRRFHDIIGEKNYNLDQRFFKSMKVILQRNGYLDTEQDLNTGLSPRQLRRVFNFYIGTTPKAFSNIVRFQHILNAKPSSESLRKNKLYYDVGFFDQAHFIKSFKTFYGVTPSEAFR